jgi:hypothetical protein
MSDSSAGIAAASGLKRITAVAQNCYEYHLPKTGLGQLAMAVFAPALKPSSERPRFQPTTRRHLVAGGAMNISHCLSRNAWRTAAAKAMGFSASSTDAFQFSIEQTVIFVESSGGSRSG